MDMTDKTLQAYLHLENNRGWYEKIDLADELHLAMEEADYILEKLTKPTPKGKLVYWVKIEHVKKYYFVPVPSTEPGSYGELITHIRELSEDGKEKVSFVELGRLTGHGPNTLKYMINKLKQRPDMMNPFKDFIKEPDIEIPYYETDEPEIA